MMTTTITMEVVIVQFILTRDDRLEGKRRGEERKGKERRLVDKRGLDRRQDERKGWVSEERLQEKRRDD